MAHPAGTVHVVAPGDIDDPMTPSGGNRYDRRVCDGLTAAGWSVREYAARGGWPNPDAAARDDLVRLLETFPDDALVLVDGLVASAVPEVLLPQARRLRLVVLMHMPFGDLSADLREPERKALSAAAAVVTTSGWTRGRLSELYGLAGDRVFVAPPGVEAAALAPGSDAGTNLLCVAAVTPNKGHDVLVEALALLPDGAWRCVCVGSLDRDPDFVAEVGRRVRAYGLVDRVTFVGPRTGADLDDSYAAADLLVLASHGETYGMVVTEALARGTPVLATAAKGLPESLGRAADGSLPGLLVAPGDPAAFAEALGRWLTRPDLRNELRQSARSRRSALTGWASTVDVVADALSRVTVAAPNSAAVNPAAPNLAAPSMGARR